MGAGAAVLILAVGAGLAGAGYIRLAPSNAGRWHVDPTTAAPPGPAGVLVQTEGGDLAGPVVETARADLLARLDRIAAATPRTRRLAGSLAEGRITYVTRSAVFGFPDYTTVTTVPAAGGARPVILARLRFGRSDLGVNRARVERWLAALANMPRS